MPEPVGSTAVWVDASPVDAGREVPEASAAPLPPSGPPELVELPIDGRPAPAVVSVPAGPFPKPLVVVAHGAGDRPDWHCGIWREIVEHRGFVLCLRGRRLSRAVPHDRARYYLPDHHYLRDLLADSVSALEAAIGDQVDTQRAVFAGYSQGGIMGSLVIQPQPDRFARAVLIEGGHTEWNVAGSQRFGAGGGSRVLVVCGIAECNRLALPHVSHMKRGGLEAQLVYVPGGGHTYDGAVGQAVSEHFDWVVAGDERWAASAVTSAN